MEQHEETFKDKFQSDVPDAQHGFLMIRIRYCHAGRVRNVHGSGNAECVSEADIYIHSDLFLTRSQDIIFVSLITVEYIMLYLSEHGVTVSLEMIPYCCPRDIRISR